jgi:hypothetical protein
MDIQDEIQEKSEHIVRLLKRGSFFEEYPFILPLKLKITLQVNMNEKYKQCGIIDLTTEELSEIVFKLNREGLSDTIYELSEKGYLKMAINKVGELVYTSTDNNKSIELLNKRQKFLLETFSIKK